MSEDHKDKEKNRRIPRIPHTDEELLKECRQETFRSSGPGGQHANTTESAVRLKHTPTGIIVTAQDERSQHRNRAIALTRLRKALEKKRHKPKPRIRTRVPRSSRRKRVDGKKRRGERKKMRKPPPPEF